MLFLHYLEFISVAEHTHRVEIVPITLEKHPDADSLSIVRVFDGYTVVVRTQDWEGVEKAAYIPPDNVVPQIEEYGFLNSAGDWKQLTPKERRIRVRRFRGILSEGMLVSAPEGASIGDDVADLLGITHYEPPVAGESGPNNTKTRLATNCPNGNLPGKYHIEAYQKFKNSLEAEEYVICTEKIHGANARFTYSKTKYVDGWHRFLGIPIWKKKNPNTMHCGSRNRWVENGDNHWWNALKDNPWIETFCKLYPGAVLYGEIFGSVQNLNYGVEPGKIGFRAFDVYDNGAFLSWPSALDMIATAICDHTGTYQHTVHLGLTNEDDGYTVPNLYEGPYDPEKIQSLSVGASLINGSDNIREGIVIRPFSERRNNRMGRVIMKLISSEYLQMK